MDYLPCPYQPGTGAQPPVLAGRADLFSKVGTRMLSVASFGRPAPSPIVLTGVRGMGKTVSLTRMRSMAQDMGLGVASARFARSGGDNMQALGEALARSSAVWDSTPSAAWDRAMQHLKEFSVEVNAGVIKLGTRLEGGEQAPGNLTDLIAETAAAHLDHDRRGLAVFVDELHTGSPDDLNTLATASQNLISDRGLPVVIVAAGTPDTAAALERAGSSFAERFSYLNVGPLNADESLAALVQPSVDLGVTWTPEAAAAALEMAQGNPWRIQQLGEGCWEAAMEQGRPLVLGSQIDARLVAAAGEHVMETLEHGSFASRWTNSTPVERLYLTAAAQSMGSDGIAQTRHIDSLMGRTSTQNSDVRATLINKGVLTAAGRGAISFSAPGFDHFVLERQNVPRLDSNILETRTRSAITSSHRTPTAQASETRRAKTSDRPRLEP
ncbi:AAA family ATPase (plasmid) [Janibacter melonis]|uniref:AAA family ATPase n=1 Tax=Janibacter melonis TaxID=262209 RepID=A0A650GFQ9_9MICO|nr:AAA family ATPase [Janibacter melonis]QGX08831.1 AAA family ATPase [Janibacter melonis]